MHSYTNLPPYLKYWGCGEDSGYWKKNPRDTILSELCIYDQVQWLTSVIPALWEAKVVRSPEIGSSRSAWPTWRNPVSTKNTKLARHGGVHLYLSYSGGWGRRIAWTQEVEVAASQDRAIALQPGQQERNSVSKNKNVYSKSKFNV